VISGDSKCADNASRRRVDELRDWVTRSDQRFLASTPRQIAEVNKKNGSSTDDWNDDDCDNVSINGGVEPKRCDREIDDEDVSASLADVGQRPTKSRRLDANAPTSSMGVRPVAAASDTAEKDGGDAMADDHSDDSPTETEIKTQRPLGLLALHAADVGAATTSRDTWRPSSAPCYGAAMASLTTTVHGRARTTKRSTPSPVRHGSRWTATTRRWASKSCRRRSTRA